MKDQAQIREQNEQLVRRYFQEVVDGRSDSTLAAIFHVNCRIVRADRKTAIEGLPALRRFVRMSIKAVPGIHTTIHSVICDDLGQVATHVQHTVRFGRFVITPVGLCFAKNRTATWEAMAFFRICDDKIIEEHVIRDEVTILRQLGMLSLGRSGALGRMQRAVSQIFARDRGKAKTND